ncbi:MAG: hypothetical protein ACOH17_15075 [Cellulomonas sp.]
MRPRPTSLQPAAQLIEQAAAAGANYQSARERMWQANRALPATGRFGSRSAARTAREATQAHGAMQDAVRRDWGDVPLTTTHLPYWAQAVAEQRADTDPRVIASQQDAERAHLEQQQLTADHAAARSALRQSIGGRHPPSGLNARAAQLRAHAQQARHHLAEIEALPSTEAAQLIRDRAAQAEAERTADTARRVPTTDPGRWRSSAPAYPSSSNATSDPACRQPYVPPNRRGTNRRYQAEVARNDMVLAFLNGLPYRRLSIEPFPLDAASKSSSTPEDP